MTSLVTNTTLPKTTPRTTCVVTAYAFFQKDQDQRNTVKAELGDGSNFRTIAKAMSERWKSLPEEEKAPYVKSATDAKASSTDTASTDSPDSSSGESKKKTTKVRTRARSGYNFYMQDQKVRDAIKKENPKADFGTISKLIGGKWKQLDDAEKTPYTQASQKEREEIAAAAPPKKTKKGGKVRKRPRNAYTLYTMDKEVRAAVRDANPGISVSGITKVLAAQWKSLSSEDRKPYDEAHQKEREEVTAAATAGVNTKPRRIRSPYNHFLKDKSIREKIKAENPEASFGEVSKLVGGKWSQMTEEDKKPYMEASAKEREESVKIPKVVVEKKKPRAKSAYTLYASSQEVRDAAKVANPEADFGEMSKIIGAQWKKLSDSMKKPYQDASQKERDEIAAAQPPKKATRAKSAYLRYSLDPKIRDVVKAVNVGMGVAGLAKILGAQWKGLNVSKKAPYQAAYEKEKAALAKAKAEAEAEAEAETEAETKAKTKTKTKATA